MIKIIKVIFKYFLYFIGLMFLIYNLTLLYVDHNMQKRVKESKSVFNDCHKIWSPRGIYHKREDQDSIKSFKEAIKDGYIGLEVDFYYDLKSKKFIVAHDRPRKGKNGELIYNLKEGKILTLEELFKAVGDGKYFWLDYKNLDRISVKTTLESIKRLEEISKIHNIKDRLYIEGCRPDRLTYYEKAGFRTLLSFHPLPRSYGILSSISSNFFKMVYYFSNSSALAMQYGYTEKNPKYWEKTNQNLKGIPQFIFHVPPDEKLIKKLYKDPDIRVLLVGRGVSVNMARLNCLKENK